MVPEDFIVREAVDIPLSEEGAYRVYLLEKRGWNTLDAILSVARASGVPASIIRYAGLKDRHALTSQHVSVPREHELTSQVADVRLSFAGFATDFISTKVLAGNAFDVTLRGVAAAEEAHIRARFPEVQRSGFPNYFDDQRFGSVTAEGEFLAERVLRGHLKGALKTYLAAVYPGQTKADRERREDISAAWGRWDAVSLLCRTPVEREIAFLLSQGANKKNLLAAINAIPRQEMAMYFAAYQGFIWNRTLQVVAGPGAGAFSIPGKAGPYTFYRRLTDAELRTLSALEIPTVSRELLPCPPEVMAAVDTVLSERGLSVSDFNLRGVRAAYFKSFYRRAIVVPHDLSAGPFLPDDLYPGHEKVRVSFFLPGGSYATMLLKALCGS